MTNQEKVNLVALVEKGAAHMEVGYYYSACVMFGTDNGIVCADHWGFALIGKFDDPVVALRRYWKVYKSLPESNPSCLRMMCAVAQLLGLDDWKQLVEIHYDYRNTERDSMVQEFRRVIFRNPPPEPWAQSALGCAFREFEEHLERVVPVH